MSVDEDERRDDAMLAGEYALGLLEGEELLTTRGRIAQEPAFAAQVEWWEKELANLADGFAGAEPGAHVWERIKARIDSPDADTSAEVIDLQARLRRWQWTAALTSVAAAVLVAVMAFPSSTTAPPAPDESPALAVRDPMIATIPIGETGLRLDVTYLPDNQDVLISAQGMTADGVHDHELWLVREDGEVASLGVVKPGGMVRTALPPEVTEQIHEGSTLLLTAEPLGGKPADKAPGPVVAEGAFAQA